MAFSTQSYSQHHQQKDWRKETLLDWVCPSHACSMIKQTSQVEFGCC